MDPQHNNLMESDGEYTYEYDEEGNRSDRFKTGEYTVYDWDHRNRLTSVTEYSDSAHTTLVQAVSYTYDNENQLITRLVEKPGLADETRAFIYEGGQVVMQFDAEGTGPLELTHRYLWGQNVDQLLADEQITDNPSVEGDVYWPLTDHLGSVKDLVISTPDGTKIEKHRLYDSFGNLVHESNRGDFNRDGAIDEEDISALIGLIAGGTFTEDLNGDGVSDLDDLAMLDLDGNGVHDTADINILITEVIATIYGDANLDGSVDITDFNIWNTYKFTADDAWDHGDFNHDGVIDVSDFNVWNMNRFQTAPGASTAPTEMIFGFTGRMFDDATGLQNNLNRWYEAATGRWINEDPIGFEAGDVNLNRYVENESTNWVDPDGLERKVKRKKNKDKSNTITTKDPFTIVILYGHRNKKTPHKFCFGPFGAGAFVGCDAGTTNNAIKNGFKRYNRKLCSMR